VSIFFQSGGKLHALVIKSKILTMQIAQ